jgi:hypothetical protein
VKFPTSLTIELRGIFDEFSIHHWGDFDDKSKCFDYDELITAREIEESLGTDVGIIPTLMDNIPMRDHYGRNEIRAETTIKILRSQIFDYDLQIRGHGSNVGPLSNTSRFRHKTRAFFRRERRGFVQSLK